MPHLFEPFQLGPWLLPHRVVMAPLTRNRAPQHMPTALMAQYYRQRANPEHGASLIVSEATAISAEAVGYLDVPGIWSAEQTSAWRAITEAVHAEGGRIVMQLWHVGRISHTSLQVGQIAPVAPSALAAKSKTLVRQDGELAWADTSMPRALDTEELPRIVADYVHAARQAMAAGFDGVEVHAANGYLLDQFLRRGSNQRSDHYGGSIANRARLLLEVMQAVTQAIGASATAIRLSPVTSANDATDDAPQALFEHVAQHLAPLGLLYVHVIEGQTGGERSFSQGEQAFDYQRLQHSYRSNGGKGAWMVNNAYDLELAEQVVSQGADLVAFGRPFIANPDLSAKLKHGWPLNAVVRKTLYGGDHHGYTDYPYHMQ